MEATGPYYVSLATYLHQQGVGVALVNPLVIKRLSQMCLLRAKTDQADAKFIAACYGQPKLWQSATAAMTELQQESMVLEGLIKQRTALQNQQEAFTQLPYVSPQPLETHQHLLETLEGQIDLLEASTARKVKEQHAQQLKNIANIRALARRPLLLYWSLPKALAALPTANN